MTEEQYDTINQMITLCHDKIRTLTELKKALRMADLIGRKPNEIKAPFRRHVVLDHNLLRPWQGATFHLKVGDEEEHVFKLTNVHIDLWPDDVRARYQKQMEKKQ